jgi:hypothetical protein
MTAAAMEALLAQVSQSYDVRRGRGVEDVELRALRDDLIARLAALDLFADGEATS